MEPISEAPIFSDDEFVTPDFTGALEIEPYLAALPEDEACKGFFFTGVVDQVSKLRPGREEDLFAGLSQRRWTAFRDYPFRDNLRLLQNAVTILYPRVPGREGLRRIGWLAHPFFAESIVGKVVYGLFGKDPDAIIASGVRAYQLCLKHGRMSTRKLAKNHWRSRYDRVAFLDTYHVGVIEGALRMYNALPRVRVRMDSITSGELDVRWV
jgi:uncharacterized protein (TIGR02265 family)